MSKIRVYELAKELELSTKEFMTILDEEFDMNIKSHMSMIEGEDLEIIREFFKEEEKEDEKLIEEENDSAIEIPLDVTVGDLAELIDVPATKIITELMKMGSMLSINQNLTFQQCEDIGVLFGVEVKEKEAEIDEDDISLLDYEDNEEDLLPRAPVVTVMGHVDHGKTSLLDAIRETRVTKSEAGGITQHIAASTVYVDNKKMVFLDTPGHEAFTQMRARGAQATDIAILVVAADDGVMPQTIEAISHAKAAGVPIIVAINKMDKYEANPERVKTELSEHGLVPEDWGGDTVMMPVSALKGEGIKELLEMVILVAEMEQLKANPNRKAVGVVVEAQLDRGRGPVATVLINKGTLKKGDYIVSGSSSGKVRAMFDSNGKEVTQAKPATAVLILGLSDVPEAGDMFYAVKNDRVAKKYAAKQKDLEKEEYVRRTSSVSLDDLYEKISDGEVKDLNIIVKTDVKGTIDAIARSLEKLSNDEVKVNIIHGAVGGITESDVMLASASNAIIIGFNVRPNQGALEQAKIQAIDIRTYRVIYEAINDVESAIKGMLAPKFVEEVIGSAQIREVFRIPSVGNIGGIYVTNGKITRNSKVRLLRNDIVIHEGTITSLKRFKDDVRELNTGYEGGLGIERYNDIKVGDTIEAFIDKEVEA